MHNVIAECFKQFLLTVNIIIVSEDHLHMIPLEKAAFPIKGLGKHYILVVPKRKRLHRYRFKI